MSVMGIPKKLVLTIGIFMDHRSKNMPLEVMFVFSSSVLQ